MALVVFTMSKEAVPIRVPAASRGDAMQTDEPPSKDAPTAMSTDDAGAAPRSGPLLLPFKCPLFTAAAVPVAGGGRRPLASGRAQPQPQQHCPEISGPRVLSAPRQLRAAVPAAAAAARQLFVWQRSTHRPCWLPTPATPSGNF